MITAFIFWGLAVIAIITSGQLYWYGPSNSYFTPFPGILLAVIGFLFYRRAKMLNRAKEAEEAAKKAEAEYKEAKEKIEEENRRQAQLEHDRKMEEIRVKIEAERTARQNYLDTHNLYETKVAGVTFDNPDRSSRQKILKALSEDPDADDYEITLHPFSFQGKDAFYVYVEDHCIGTIPAMCVKKIKEIYPKTDNIELTISDFENEGEKTIYAARLTFGYPKESEDE